MAGHIISIHLSLIITQEQKITATSLLHSEPTTAIIKKGIGLEVSVEMLFKKTLRSSVELILTIKKGCLIKDSPFLFCVW